MDNHESKIADLNTRLEKLEVYTAKITILTDWQIRVLTWTANVVAGFASLGVGAIAVNSGLKAFTEILGKMPQ